MCEKWNLMSLWLCQDLFKNSDGFDSKSQNVVATINGSDLDRDEFMNKVELDTQNNTMRSRALINNAWPLWVKLHFFPQ